MLNEENALLWLASVSELTPRRKCELLERAGSAAELAELNADKLVKLGVHENTARQLYAVEPERVAAESLGKLYKKEIDFISCNSEEYPKRLKQLNDYPIGLFKIGRFSDLENYKTVGVVGSRRCTSYGAATTLKIAGELAARGIVVVSGMADGIDSMAHKGALEAEGYTIAVLGCGVDICYPSGNRELMERIKEKGCVISEFPPATRPSKYTFPARNRIISGLSDIVAVMEAGSKSGTLITVDHANDQGKDVMALPGNISSRLSYGTNSLIKEGAGVITCTEDILNALGIENNNYEKISEKNNIPLETNEKLVYDCIRMSIVTAEEIAVKIKMPLNEVQYNLTMLELKGCIAKLSGQRYMLLN